ncbi:C6 transcription factor, putative [Talaromyces stipitatus ATCC 10500]|uniref:C6 transcription factor, putative n=1 Tax=Talaromyces stipitatus (strain ATCC 10500 / CBS 375.48 / QM 6759 / NRRL 1006) TaxID=441959 RepID=B8MKT2_TALSN|nr:C6 transcription factor, putative [Talaromyces stipitatus ATCC 10500]EED14931.1 C6 transcription factor, putative [Talaromyces stipitatus ATCC 10500]
MSENIRMQGTHRQEYPHTPRRKRVGLAYAKRQNVQVNILSARIVHGFIRLVHIFRVVASLGDRLRPQPSMLALRARLMDLLGWYELLSCKQIDIPFYQDHAIPSLPNWENNAEVALPPWEKVLEIAQVFLVYCDCQPLPLFHRQTLLATLGHRDPEVVYAILALAIRFCSSDVLTNADGNTSSLGALVPSYLEAARERVIKRALGGPVEISTLQTLCLLSMVEYTNDNTHQAIILSSLAMNLAKCANLAFESASIHNHAIMEERRRCFWSICLLRRFQGEDVHVLDFASPETLAKYPKSTGIAPDITKTDTPSLEVRIARGMKDEGIVAYYLQLSEIFSRTAGYVKHRGRSNGFLPWSPESEYSKIIALQMESETRVPYVHRFKFSGIPDRTVDDLQSNRDYWGPWFFNQFMYHTILCLLNHPLLLSLSLRNHRSTIPEIFIQHSSDMISTHTSWIVYFVRYFEEKRFRISDPFLGYCAAVVATIELQLSFTEDESIRKDKQERFESCLNFVQDLGKEWPHMAKMAEKLQALNGAVSASYVPYSRTQDKSLVIDLSRFWEILDYSSGFSDERSSLFGSTLFSESRNKAHEVSSTTPLPEPTRIRVSRRTSQQATGNSGTIPEESGYDFDTGLLPSEINIHGDQYSMLAENFFSQGQDFLRNTEDWFTAGNL